MKHIDLRTDAVCEWLEHEGWSIARGELQRRLNLIRAELIGKDFESIEEVARLQGQARLLIAMLENPVEFFKPMT